MTSGRALRSLTSTGVPLASASSADRPKVSAGPGAITMSAVASSCASAPRCAMCPRNRTGSRAAWACSVWRRGPSPAMTRTAGTPAAAQFGQGADGAFRPLLRGEPAAVHQQPPAAGGEPGTQALVRAGRVEAGQVDAERHLDQVRHAEPPELPGGPGRRADHDVERRRRVAVEPVDQPSHGQPRRPEHRRERGQAVVRDHHGPDAAAPGPGAGPPQRRAVGHLEPVRLQVVEQPPQRAPRDDRAVPAGARDPQPGHRDHQPLLGLPVFRPGSRHDQDRLVPRGQVAGTEFPEGGPEPPEAGAM